MIIEAAKKIFNFDKLCRSYIDLNFGVTFFGTQCRTFVNGARYAETPQRPEWCSSPPERNTAPAAAVVRSSSLKYVVQQV